MGCLLSISLDVASSSLLSPWRLQMQECSVSWQVPEELLKFGTTVKKKESKLYGAHFKVQNSDMTFGLAAADLRSLFNRNQLGTLHSPRVCTWRVC